MLYDGKIWIGTGAAPVCLLPQMANRHGLIAGATGTGKTVSLKVLAEGFSAMGVPVFLSDVKGDLAGMALPGEHSDALAQRLGGCGVTSFRYQDFPTVFWDVYGEQGHPVRATVSEMGPILLSRMLGLNETQTGVMNILFRVADDEGMLLLDLKDLKAVLAYLGEHARDYTLKYGNVSTATVGAIQRAVAVLEDQGGDRFFGEPALDLADWLQLDEEGRGVINILAADKLFLHPVMYSTFMLWMLSELYELLPEQGDLDKPRMVFFFDEAHLLFGNCARSLLEKIEQVVRLIRSKGVGVYFITQSPADIPMSVLGQLGNRIQHALRAYTPQDQKAVRTAAQTFRANPAFDTEEAIASLKTGEALVSFLDENGAPGVVERATILPPQSSMKGIDPATRQAVVESSPFRGVYDEAVDRESAYELLAASFQREQAPAPVQAFRPVPAAQVQVTSAQPAVSQPQGFKVFDPATGQYVQREIPTMSPLPQQPVVQQPVVQQPAAPQVQQMPVMMYDPATGQYVQRMMTMQLDPATGNYVAVQPQNAAPASPQDVREAEKQRIAAEKAEKERKAEERRQRADELREERAERARRN
ncbi:MAG: helicase HerA-like domain-containing protein, partial [Aristaeellaceae bacterium]